MLCGRRSRSIFCSDTSKCRILQTLESEGMSSSLSDEGARRGSHSVQRPMWMTSCWSPPDPCWGTNLPVTAAADTQLSASIQDQALPACGGADESRPYPPPRQCMRFFAFCFRVISRLLKIAPKPGASEHTGLCIGWQTCPKGLFESGDSQSAVREWVTLGAGGGHRLGRLLPPGRVTAACRRRSGHCAGTQG